MTTEELKQPQVSEQQLQPVPGAEKPQAQEVAEVAEPGAEVKPQETPQEKAQRMYTEEEFRKLQAQYDTQLSELRKRNAEMALRTELQQRYAQEEKAKAEDKKSVEEGLLSEQEAQRRAQMRQGQFQSELQFRQAQQAHQVLLNENENLAKSRVANYLVTEKKLTESQVKELMGDKNIKTADQIEARVAKYEAENYKKRIKELEEGEPVYDGGITGGSGRTSTEGLHGLELAEAAYSKEETSRRQRNRKR